ncbi:spore germination protein GerPE [Bacillus sp. T3]|uniref:spore germination protein GerPE n=1 Tax=Bacillus sp. T3 TaxID=467262 RepID=UPI002981EF94|nr:spore germination protein GerPE [Bacillus sp. T3]
MLKRTSVVNSLIVDSLQFSSLIELGDSSCIQGGNRALAVQREREVFFGNEGDYSKYLIFSEQIPIPPITEWIAMEHYHCPGANIKVGNIRILGVSAASIVHVGNSCSVHMESRVKHIRQLESAREKRKAGGEPATDEG